MVSCTIDLWTWSLDKRGEPPSHKLTCLSNDELSRADRFVFERDRQRFIAGRQQLRTILSTYTRSDPKELCFAYSRTGKPRIDQKWRTDAPYFNLSHSGPMAMLAVSYDTELGLDIEQIRPMEYDVANRFFSTREQEALAKFKGPDWTKEFYRLWTLKEAFLKARGDGLFHPLDKFDIAFSQDPPRLLRLEGDQQAPDRWTLHSFLPSPDTLGALAVAKGNAVLNIRNRQND